SLSRNDRFANVEQFREALWQVIHANPMAPMVTQIPKLAMAVPAEEQRGSLLLEPMFTPLEEKHAVPDVNLGATQTPELAVVVPTGEHTALDTKAAISTPELAVVVPTGEHTALDTKAAISTPELEIVPESIVIRRIQAKVTPAAASS